MIVEQPRGFFQLADMIIASALTPLHPGAGRSPGVVDLPVIRDPFGFPYVPGSSLKGSLKSTLAQKRCLNMDQCIDDRGFIICGNEVCKKCSNICCLLGPEPGEGDKGASAVAFTELLPFMFPVPSLEHGYVYATSPYLAARGLAILEAGADTEGTEGASNSQVAALKNLLNAIVELEKDLEPDIALALRPKRDGSTDSKSEEHVTIGLDTYMVKSDSNKESIDKNTLASLKEVLEKLNPLYKAGPIEKRLYVFSDNDMTTIVEKALYRVTRVAIRRDTKTVSRGALWTEEYLPPGTLFLGLVAYAAGRNEYCGNSMRSVKSVRSRFYDLLKDIGGKDGFAILIGGKETIGKGLLRASILNMI